LVEPGVGAGPALLTVEGVSKSFGGLVAVRDIDLAVDEGEILGLIGPNGSGKTTLFNVITGVYRPDAGSIRLSGREIAGLPPAQLCKLGIARTFQHVRPFQNLTVLDNVAVGRIYGREAVRSRAQGEEEARELLEMVGLTDGHEARAGSLTLLGRKRLELARALATRPRLLLLDELLAGLNASEVVAALDLIRRIRTGGVTIIMVEHLVKVLFGISDRVIVLNAGEKIADGPPESVMADEGVITAYLGTGQHA
jgi:branched-chain amino acid transport system ATP-binding protein